MKFDQFMSYVTKNVTKTATQKLVPDPFVFAKN